MSGTPPEDRELAAAFLLGDEPAFRELYRRHTPRIYPLVRRMLVPHPGDADDVVQEVWLRAARGLAGFRWESSLRTWLTGIALNLCRERLRARRHVTEEPFEDGTGTPAALPAILADVDLERALAALPEGYRRVLLLHDAWGMTHDEIGQALAIDVGTSKSQLFRARRAIRALLAVGVGPASKGRER